MNVTIELPDDVLAALEGQWGDVPKRSLEAVAVEGYRSGALTESRSVDFFKSKLAFRFTRC